MPSAVASRYARALVDAVLGPSSDVEPRRAIEQLRAFESLLAESVDLRNVLLSPAAGGARKRAVIARLGETLSLSRLITNFLYVLIDHRRMDALSDIREAYEAQLDERLGLARAQIRSALPLSEDQKQRLQATLSLITGKQVRGHFEVDETLLGGAVARVGSTIYDGSAKGQLEALRRKLVE